MFAGERLANSEQTAFAGCTSDFNCSPVRAANRFDYRQSETGAALVSGSGVVNSEETFEHVRQRIGGDADPVISDV